MGLGLGFTVRVRIRVRIGFRVRVRRSDASHLGRAMLDEVVLRRHQRREMLV